MKSIKEKLKENTDQKRPTVWEQLSQTIDNHQRQLAAYIGRQSEKLSRQTKTFLLLAFAIVIGGISLTLVIRSFQDSPAKTLIIPLGIKTPALVKPHQYAGPLLSGDEYKILIDFKQTLDSLKTYDRATYDELLKGREGLLDSINFLISIH